MGINPDCHRNSWRAKEAKDVKLFAFAAHFPLALCLFTRSKFSRKSTPTIKRNKQKLGHGADSLTIPVYHRLQPVARRRGGFNRCRAGLEQVLYPSQLGGDGRNRFLDSKRTWAVV